MLKRISSSPSRVWLALSLIAGALYALLILPAAFGGPNVIADDGRQHLFWLARLREPELFPGDRIADYFQSVAPAGFVTLYRVAGWLGFDPIFFSKLLPLPLSLATAFFAYQLAIALFPVPVAGWVAALLFLQNLWLKDDLASGTARAFLNPLFLALLWAWAKGWRWGVAIALVALGVFYPHYVLVTGGMAAIALLEPWLKQGSIKLQIKKVLSRLGSFLPIPKARSPEFPDLVRWDHSLPPQRARSRSTGFPTGWRFPAIVLGLSLGIIAFYALAGSEFGPVITPTQAQQLPEFLPNGRARFFYPDWGRFWLSASRSGLQVPLDPPLLILGLFLPLITCFPQQFPLVARVQPAIVLLPRLLAASLGLFCLAHALLFRLHLPSRYSQHALRVVLSMAAAIVLVTLLDALRRWATRTSHLLWRQWLWQATALGVALWLVVGPLGLRNFPKASYAVGESPALYEFLRRQPTDSLVAGLGDEVNNVPSFARRSVLVSAETAIPYHWGYYREFRERVRATLAAQYSPDLKQVNGLGRRYGVRFWLLDRTAFDPAYLDTTAWLKPYEPEWSQARASLQNGEVPALKRAIDRCQVFMDAKSILLDTQCLDQEMRLP